MFAECVGFLLEGWTMGLQVLSFPDQGIVLYWEGRASSPGGTSGSWLALADVWGAYLSLGCSYWCSCLGRDWWLFLVVADKHAGIGGRWTKRVACFTGRGKTSFFLSFVLIDWPLFLLLFVLFFTSPDLGDIFIMSVFKSCKHCFSWQQHQAKLLAQAKKKQKEKEKKKDKKKRRKRKAKKRRKEESSSSSSSESDSDSSSSSSESEDEDEAREKRIQQVLVLYKKKNWLVYFKFQEAVEPRFVPKF